MMGGLARGPFGLGCAQLGNLYGAISDEAAATTVDAAWDAGVRYFDTAPHYGLGLSERRLGAALAVRPRSEYVVSTKVGRMLDRNLLFDGSQRDDEGFDVPADRIRRWDFSEEGIRASIEASLDRLGLEKIDLVLIHDPEQNLADPGQGLREAVPVLERMRSEGSIQAFGVGTRSTRTLETFVRESSIDFIMLAGRYTLLDHEAVDSLLPACIDHDVSVLNVGIFNSGLLARPRPAADAHYEYQPVSDDLRARVNDIANVCDEFETSVPRAALAFAVSHPAIAITVLGASSARQVRASAEVLVQPAPIRDFWVRLVECGLLEASVFSEMVFD